MAIELNKWALVTQDDETGTRLLRQFRTESEIEYKLEVRHLDSLSNACWSSVYDIKADRIYSYKRADEYDQRRALFGLCRMAAK